VVLRTIDLTTKIQLQEILVDKSSFITEARRRLPGTENSKSSGSQFETPYTSCGHMKLDQIHLISRNDNCTTKPLLRCQLRQIIFGYLSTIKGSAVATALCQQRPA